MQQTLNIENMPFYRLNYIFSELNPRPFHLTNLLLHSICSTLSLVIFATLLRENRPRLSFISAVIFSVHPVHTEAVRGRLVLFSSSA